MNYEMCNICNRALINEPNLAILRLNLTIYGVIGVTSGGVVGAYALPLLGFGKSGVIGGSLAAGWQGPAVAAGSWFATFQSLGATGLGKLLFGAVGSISGGGALGLIDKINFHSILYEFMRKKN